MSAAVTAETREQKMETHNTHKDYLKQLRTATAVSTLLGNDLSAAIAGFVQPLDDDERAEILEKSWAVKNQIDIQVLSEAFTTALGHVRDHRRISQPSTLSEQDRRKNKWVRRLHSVQRSMNQWRGNVRFELHWSVTDWASRTFPPEDSPVQLFAANWLAEKNQSPINWKVRSDIGKDLICLVRADLKFFTEVMPFFNRGKKYDFTETPQLEKLAARSAGVGAPYQYLVTALGQPQNWYEDRQQRRVETTNNISLRQFTGVEVFGPSNDKQLMIGQHWVAYMGDTIDPDESVVATNRSPMQAYQMLRKRIAKHMMSQL